MLHKQILGHSVTMSYGVQIFLVSLSCFTYANSAKPQKSLWDWHYFSGFSNEEVEAQSEYTTCLLAQMVIANLNQVQIQIKFYINPNVWHSHQATLFTLPNTTKRQCTQILAPKITSNLFRSYNSLVSRKLKLLLLIIVTYRILLKHFSYFISSVTAYLIRQILLILSFPLDKSRNLGSGKLIELAKTIQWLKDRTNMQK